MIDVGFSLCDLGRTIGAGRSGDWDCNCSLAHLTHFCLELGILCCLPRYLLTFLRLCSDPALFRGDRNGLEVSKSLCSSHVVRSGKDL